MPDVTQSVRDRVRIWVQAQPLCEIPLRGQRRRPTQGHSCFPSQTCPLPQAELFPLIPGPQWGPNQWGLIGPSSPGLGWKSTPTAPAIQMSPHSFNLEQNQAARFSYPAPTHVSDAGVLSGRNPSLTPGEPSENSESLLTVQREQSGLHTSLAGLREGELQAGSGVRLLGRPG